MKERDLVNEAVKDAKALKEAALSAAKNQLIETLAPSLKEMLEKSINGALNNEGVNRIRRGIEDNWPGESHTGFEESKKEGETKMDAPDKKDDKELDLESLASFFPAMTEEPEHELETEAEKEPELEGIQSIGEDSTDFSMGEAKKKSADDEDEEPVEKEPVDEEIEISESELNKVYEAALKTEVTVKKGFSEMTPNGEIEDVVKDIDKGLLDTKKGEHEWAKEEPPAKQDFTVKEMIARGMAENKKLRENLKNACKMIQTLGSKLHEVNLFNAKVMHVNRALQQGHLTAEQKKVVMESIDRAETIKEVKMVYEAITRSFKSTASLTEARRPKPNHGQGKRTSGAPDQKVLRESVDKNNDDVGFGRINELAGLIK
jgi:glycerol-3-phosphate cytidylyltransferase-like family protein